MDIRQVVLWGHKLHSHTHSYIHNAYVIAFKHLGYKTLWLDNNDDISGIDFTGTFFITEGQVHQNMPVRNDCYYVLHNCDMKRYCDLPERQYMCLQVYTHDVVNKHFATPIDVSVLSYYKEKDNCLWIPWATDLLPHQIDENIAKLKGGEFKNHNVVSFVGSMTRPWAFVKQFCDNNNIRFLNLLICLLRITFVLHRRRLLHQLFRMIGNPQMGIFRAGYLKISVMVKWE